MKNLFFSLCILFTVGCQQEPISTENSMTDDEQNIRSWYEDWLRSTTEGDLDLARKLIADDAIFLVPGAGQMDKESFAAAATASDPNIDFELDCSIQEIKVIGDHAWLLDTISLKMTDKTTKVVSLMKGDSLSILQKKGAAWTVVRDANTMISVDADN